MAVEPIPSEKRFWQARTKLPTRPRPGHTSATLLAIRAAISIAYGSHRTLKSSPFATSSSMRTRCSTRMRNLCVNTAYKSTEKTLMVLSPSQTVNHLKMRTQIRKSGLLSLWVVKMTMESIQMSQKMIQTTRTSLGTILHPNLWMSWLIRIFHQIRAQLQHQTRPQNLNLPLSSLNHLQNQIYRNPPHLEQKHPHPHLLKLLRDEQDMGEP